MPNLNGKMKKIKKTFVFIVIYLLFTNSPLAYLFIYMGIKWFAEPGGEIANRTLEMEREMLNIVPQYIQQVPAETLILSIVILTSSIIIAVGIVVRKLIPARKGREVVETNQFKTNGIPKRSSKYEVTTH